MQNNRKREKLRNGPAATATPRQVLWFIFGF